MSNPIISLDVREDIRSGREPFTKIMETVGRLGAHEDLLLLAPFEPTPLFHVLARKGFQHSARATASGDWEVLFSRSMAPNPQASNGVWACQKSAPAPKTEDIELDARGLEPPQPLITILQALTTLHPGATLNARTDRKPMHLYAELESRGFTGTTEEQTDGSYLTRITRR